MGRMIYYTGPGCRCDFLHSKQDFLNTVTAQFPETVYLRRKGDPKGIPPGKIKSGDLPGWMIFTNAHWVIPEH